MKETHYISH